jgi:hypothetical protein
MLVFYESREYYNNPKIGLEHPENDRALLKFGRVMSWSVLLALIIRAIDRKFGIVNKKDSRHLPYA